MKKKKRPPGWANPRARPFVGRRVFWTKFHQLYGAMVGQHSARKNEGSLLDFPPILQLQTKTGCNAACVFCPQKSITDMFPKTEMSDELFRNITAQCAGESKLFGVGFVLQNEPLTDSTIFSKISYFRKQVQSQAMTFLVTNGTLLTSEVADKILDCGLDAMHISCNGFGKEDFEATNQGKSWEEFRTNLEHFLSRDLSKIAVMLSFVRSNLYRKELEKAIQYWRSRGFHCFVHGINNRGGAVENYEIYARPMEKEKFLVRNKKKFIKNLLSSCPYPFLQMSVLATGECLICTHDWQRLQIIGNLNNQSILEVWNGPVMQEIRLKHLHGREKEIPACKNCDVFENVTFV